MRDLNGTRYLCLLPVLWKDMVTSHLKWPRLKPILFWHLFVILPVQLHFPRQGIVLQVTWTAPGGGTEKMYHQQCRHWESREKQSVLQTHLLRKLGLPFYNPLLRSHWLRQLAPLHCPFLIGFSCQVSLLQQSLDRMADLAQGGSACHTYSCCLAWAGDCILSRQASSFSYKVVFNFSVIQTHLVSGPNLHAEQNTLSKFSCKTQHNICKEQFIQFMGEFKNQTCLWMGLGNSNSSQEPVQGHAAKHHSTSTNLFKTGLKNQSLCFYNLCLSKNFKQENRVNHFHWLNLDHIKAMSSILPVLFSFPFYTKYKNWSSWCARIVQTTEWHAFSMGHLIWSVIETSLCYDFMHYCFVKLQLEVSTAARYVIFLISLH